MSEEGLIKVFARALDIIIELSNFIFLGLMCLKENGGSGDKNR